MSKHAVVELKNRAIGLDPLSELLRTGAQRLIHLAVGLELQDCWQRPSNRLTEAGRAGVVRNGYMPERELQTRIGPIKVKIPKVRAKTGEVVTFRSA